MLHTILITVYLILAGAIAGFLSSVAGLASLVSYPVLLSVGVPPVSADVTNTAALIFTGLGSTMSSTKELKGNRTTMWHVGLLTALGGIVGCLILAFLPSSSFEHVVPFLILLAAVMMMVSGKEKATVKAAQPTKLWIQIARNIAIFLVGIYIGYFGAAAGIFLLAILTVTLTKPFVVSNAIKNFSSLLTNVISLVIYAFTIKVYWLMAVPLAAGMFIGGYVGPVVIRHVPVKLLRGLITIAAFGLSGYLFYTAYFVK
ncbi:sulfite exporter TauE/SafE family protein [Lactobacillus sp. LC28-10]|uniref:Probable membrane transporter protein n=1 Tax=Secundilactobacillus angelensis TaxID=2722706 RepID=A0ABX1KTS4_9LACO|nr:sulfite exporter TauE/SafE family protein [Secundilactobacillus angelensis]MCH5461848.1 sulfite exporter TauE/SafE family protein [Secundilactobacillus angelensis]NLR17336.1 sulfite exporter TauE/SafE family protein [Secundilactobacillus angelensis]